MEDWDIWYQFINEISYWLSLFMSGYCYCYLVKGFIRQKQSAWRAGAAYIVVMGILWEMPFYIENYMAYGLGALAGFLVLWQMEKKNLKQKIFLAVTFYSLRGLTIAMAQCIEDMATKSLYCHLGFSGDAGLQFGVFAVADVIYLISGFAFMFLSVWLIGKTYVLKRDEMTGKELVMLVIPSLSGDVGRRTLKYLCELYIQDTGKAVFELTGAYNGLCFLFYFLSFGAVLVMIVMFQRIKAQQGEDKQNEFLARQREDMKKYVEQVEKLYRDIRSIRHDMGNHVMVLENLYTRQEYQEAGEYAARIREEISGALPEGGSGNLVTDVILTEKRKEAEEKGIEFVSVFYYPKGTRINAFDMGVILNNVLTNALDAAVKCRNPRVEIHSGCQKNAYMIEIQNNYSGEIVFDEDSGLPATTKENTHSHGFGLANVRKVARAYGGDIDIAYDGEIFSLRIMLMLE